MGKRERLDLLLVERRLVESREAGRRYILAGEVLVGGHAITKVGTLVDVEAPIRLKEVQPYVSRGGLKLAKALGEFPVTVRDKVVLDVGASTGGFTDCLLKHGARQVFAVDVGYGQLHWGLRTDPRVVVFEKTNIRYLTAGQLPRLADLATIDASFISLQLILPVVRSLLVPQGEVVALIKPQFEVGKGRVGKGGVVRSQEEHRRVITEISEFARGSGYDVGSVVESPITGPSGNREFLIHLRATTPGP